MPYINHNENGNITGQFACQQYEGQIYTGLIIDDEEKFQVVNGVVEKLSETQYSQEQTEKRETQFNKDFFLTSQGYVRRKAYIQGTKETKDFLSDCLPALCNAFSLGQSIRAIIYNKPPMTADVTDWSQYQKTDIEWTTEEQQIFLSDCLSQYQRDFFGD